MPRAESDFSGPMLKRLAAKGIKIVGRISKPNKNNSLRAMPAYEVMIGGETREMEFEEVLDHAWQNAKHVKS